MEEQPEKLGKYWVVIMAGHISDGDTIVPSSGINFSGVGRYLEKMWDKCPASAWLNILAISVQMILLLGKETLRGSWLPLYSISTALYNMLCNYWAYT